MTGRWTFASGCQHSTWLVNGCQVFDGDTQRLDSAGSPETVWCYLPVEQGTILDT